MIISFHAHPLDLELSRPFRISRGSRTQVRNVLVSVQGDGVIGLGEGSPYPRYGESQQGVLQLLEGLDPAVLQGEELESVIAAVAAPLAASHSALAAVDLALHDWHARRRGISVLQQWGLDPHPDMPTSFTIGLDRPEVMAERAVDAARRYRVLKIKLGSREDRAIIAAVDEAVRDDCPVRVDANEGWSDRVEALENLRLLAERGRFELVEQPLAAGRLDDMAWLKQRSPLPLFADEESASVEDMATLARGFHGVNIKLDKCGGLAEARRRIEAARQAGLSVMIGCMVASSLSITAAAHLTPLCDYADLDGHLLLADDPYDGVRVENGRLVLPEDRTGLGVNERSEERAT